MLEKLNQLSDSHGALAPGRGLISGVIALCLGILCLLGVLAFHFPQYLTTPELRRSYDVEVIRTVMFVALVLAGGRGGPARVTLSGPPEKMMALGGKCARNASVTF